MSPATRAERLFDQAKRQGLVNPVTGDGAPSIGMVTDAINDAESDGYQAGKGDKQQSRIKQLARASSFAEGFMSNCISVDKIIWLASLDDRRSCPLRDALELDMDNIFKALALKVPRIDEDEDNDCIAEILLGVIARSNKHGFLVQACTPFPMFAEGNTYSWGAYTTRWFYTEGLDGAFIEQVIAWKKAVWAKEQARLAKAKSNTRKKGGAR